MRNISRSAFSFLKRWLPKRLFKATAFLCLGIAGLLLWSSVVAAEHYDVYLLAGQSNMDGRGAVKDLAEADQAPNPNAIIYYRNFLASSKSWKPLAPGFSIPPKHKDGLPSKTLGPELGFAKAMLQANPDTKLALIKGSKGGSNLRADWVPGQRGKPKSQGPLYRDFIETIQIATKELTDRGDTFTIRAMIWHQGESDSKSKKKVYQARLENLIARIREDVGIEDLPVVVGEVYDNGKRDSVRAAIAAVGNSSPKLGLVSSKGLTTWDAGTHFDAASQLKLGKRYAASVLKILDKTVGDAPNNDTPTSGASAEPSEDKVPDRTSKDRIDNLKTAPGKTSSEYGNDAKNIALWKSGE